MPETAERPRATYRLQLGPALDFDAATELVGYLAALGVTHLYCSPVLQARAGSTHGYDVADPTRVSGALGGAEGLRRLADAARDRGLGLVVDAVPNHVGTGPDNPLWEALLAEGPAGDAAVFFDVEWTPPLPGADGKVILPVLGAPYGEVLTNGELTIDADGDTSRLRYHEHSFPLSAQTRTALDRAALDALEGTRGEPESWHRLHGLLESQHYRLVHWRAGDALVNYRRFFAIDELAAVRVEDEAVFDHLHATLVDLVDGGLVDGLRLDHVDGLTDPAGYLERLRAAVGDDTWIVVEKILGPDEVLPGWPVAGTTGYDFLADVLGLFVDPAGEAVLTEVARGFDAWPASLDALSAAAKREVLDQDLAADAERLVDRLWALTQEHLGVRDVSRAACRDAARETVVALDVYRAYTQPGEVCAPGDAERVGRAVGTASAHTTGVPDFLWAFLEDLLCGRCDGTPLHAETVRRFHQVASAAMAKGVEDTLLYRQHRLVALNEVGVEPDRFGSTVAAFHAANRARAARHPEGMLTTSTHDTKRGEDARLRTAALSEVPQRWSETVRRWRDAHTGCLRETSRGPAPDPATAYLCYQTLVGVWPHDGQPDVGALRERVGAYLRKAAREDRRRTSWTDPDEAFEEALEAFVAALLGDEAFLAELGDLGRMTGEIAVASGLSQVLLRCTSPGVPDTYQGLELWDDSLVDPDNRRPVDFAARARLLGALDDDPPTPAELVGARTDGRLKLWVLSRALRTRTAHPTCFGAAAGYEPLTADGAHAERVVAFARTGDDGPVVVIAPRLVGPLVERAGGPPLGAVWDDTTVALPDGPAAWRCALGGAGALGAGAPLADVLADLPIALLVPAGRQDAAAARTSAVRAAASARDSASTWRPSPP